MKIITLLADSLFNCESLRELSQRLDAGQDASVGIAQSARAFLVAARFTMVPQPTLVVVPGEEAANDFARCLSCFLGENTVARFSLRTDYPWTEKHASAEEIAKRAEALYVLASGEDRLVVASARALQKYLVPPSLQHYLPLVFSCNNAPHYNCAPLNYEETVFKLESLGYTNTNELEGAGTFALRGGTIDVFPGNLSFPVRLDFFGDELEDIRRIVPSTGQTIQHIEAVRVFPAKELIASKRSIARAKDKLYNPSKTNPILREMLEKLEEGIIDAKSDALLPYLYETPSLPADYLCEQALTVLIEPRSLIDDALHFYDELQSLQQGRGYVLSDLYCEGSKLDFGKNQRLTCQSIMRVGTQLDAEIPIKRTEVAGDPENLYGRLRTFLDQGYTTVLFMPDYRVREDIKLELLDHRIPFVEKLDYSSNLAQSLHKGVVNISDTELSYGFVVPGAKLALVSLLDTQKTGRFSKGKQVDITEITFPFAPGDYVVHAAHGIAFFKDLVKQEVGGSIRDYLLLEYASEDKLYVPVEQLDRVTRYVGPEGSSPRLTRLNTQDWSRALTRARKASRKLAFDLVDVYTRRLAAKGYAFSADTPWQKQMEDDFLYAETTDQLAAIADVKADMQSARPMDRLICGDVGFGKTEVALRAAFKATQDGKQVMVLCPTTILAQQHYTTFNERFASYGIHVEVLSRFRTPAQQKEALEGFSKGTVDVLIGTHRLLSRDVNPHDLGLLIIDEEQRFGVGHKEQLKNMRESIDMLTLSATPIPRTLQMSLSGVRDMSLILTPPDDRRPVEVHVGEWDPDLVSAAITHELNRSGQVYYVSNRVARIQDALDRVVKAAPSARVGVAHGQMSKEALESVMEDFSAGVIDVLVATTIIESGIDNPHTNTLIIEDSQRLGLAQMYQLKGRVGRSSTQAYAYFMFPENASMTEDALARLTALNELQDLGSGMRIAMRDLEIRGAGTLLGAEQSGNVSSVGFDLFAQMIATAVQEARENNLDAPDVAASALSDITVNVSAHAYIPEEYIFDTDERVLLYRKIAYASTQDTVSTLRTETQEKYGAMPTAAQNCFLKSEIKAICLPMGIQLISVAAGKLNIEPVSKPKEEIWDALHKAKARYISDTGKLMIPLRYFALPEDGGILEAIRDLLTSLGSDNT